MIRCKPKVKIRSQGTRDLIRGLAELEALVRDHAKPEDRFTTRTLTFPSPGEYSPAAVRALRSKLMLSQAFFAEMLGVSCVLVQGWEQGVRTPSRLACRLLDTISTDPAAWLASLQRVVNQPSRRAS